MNTEQLSQRIAAELVRRRVTGTKSETAMIIKKALDHEEDLREDYEAAKEDRMVD
jgi:hypothetical protein